MGSGRASAPVRPREERVPFVRRCRLEFDDGRTTSALLVNISLSGAYVAHDDLYTAAGPTRRAASAEADADMPRLDQAVTCSFQLPGRSHEVEVQAVVTWLNPHQQHPVHSLPPGFGLRFLSFPESDRPVLERLIQESLSAQARSGRR